MDAEGDTRLDALQNFVNQEKKVVTNELKDIIKDIAKKGRYTYPWEYLKPLFSHELEQVMDNFLENFPPKNANGTDEDKIIELKSEKTSILKAFSSFTSAPFTIQRLSELVSQPRKHYKSCAKFFRGLKKNLLVVSTVEPEETDVNANASFESDTDESPSKKLRLEEEREQKTGTESEAVVSDLKEPNTEHFKETAVTNGVLKEEGLQEELETQKNKQEGDLAMQDTLDQCSLQNEDSVCQTDEQQPDKSQASDQGEECNLEQRGKSSADCIRKDEVGNIPQNKEQQLPPNTDLFHIDTPL